VLIVFSKAKIMRMRRRICQFALVVLCSWSAVSARAGDLHINLPKQGRLTPVQSLNRDGVKAVKRGHMDRAKKLFVQAYLLDPDDPFTLNNLGYISETEGDADHALKYYQLAAHTPSEAVIDDASKPGLKGQSVTAAFSAAQASGFASNRANLQAVVLLQNGRAFEAESLLRNAIQENPKNPFLLDNLGYAMELEGDLESALKYYAAAAALHSEDHVILTPNPKLRGRPISEVAAQSARAVTESIAKEKDDTNARIARLNLRGVAALNRNDTPAAQKFFSEAYALDPKNAFTLNNLGYIAELGGDRETAETYYQGAGDAAEAGARVTYATREAAEGLKVSALAGDNQEGVEGTLQAIRDEKRREGRPIELMRRDQAAAPGQEPPLSVEPPPLPPLQIPDRARVPAGSPPSSEQSSPPPNRPTQ
jgi:Flp pilus assembly protein TadD